MEYLIERRNGGQTDYLSMKVARSLGGTCAFVPDRERADKFVNKDTAVFHLGRVPQDDRDQCKVIPNG